MCCVCCVCCVCVAFPLKSQISPGSYASAVTTGEPSNHLIKQSKPFKDTFEAIRKFNIVIFAIEECRQGAKRPERLAFDLSKVESVLVDVDGSLKSSSIKDCYHLGKYSADQERSRPLLVKFVRIEDVSKVLAKRWAAKSPIVVKPDMTREERIRESTLLKHRWNLICSGVPKRAIKISRAKIFVNNVEYGTYSQSGFVLSSNRPVQNIPVNGHPSNLGSQTLSKPTSITSHSVSPVPVSTLDTQPTVVAGLTPHSTPLCLSSSTDSIPASTPGSTPVTPSLEHSNLPSHNQ